jgi:ABC-type lipoprotein release transport system permease subunit
MGARKIAAIAWRNLWRNRRRTAITLSSIAFGILLAVLFTGMGDANFSAMIDLAARMGGGHVTLQHTEYLDSPTLSRSVQGVEALRRVALEDPDVERVVTRISGHLMISSAVKNTGAAFIAFDPAVEDVTTLSLLEAVTEGELPGSSARGGIVLGRRLADNLDADIGRKVVYTVTDKDGQIVQEAVRVTGIMETGAPSVDGGLCLLSLAQLRVALGYGEDEAVQVAVFLGDQRRAEVVAARLAGQLGSGAEGRAGIAALPWHELQPELAGFIAMKVASARFMEAIIMLLVAAGIFNTLFVSVMERMREFGIMRAIGWSQAQISGLVMFESLWLAVVGLVLAVVVTAGPYWYLSEVGIDLAAMGVAGTEVAGVAMTDVMRVGIFPENAVMIAAAAVLATLLSGVYPAWSAGRVVPVEAIRLV